MSSVFRARISIFLVVLVSGAVLAAGALAAPVAMPKLPAGWSHAEINVTIRGIPHTKIYDRGVVTAVTPRSLTLNEPDGSIVTIQLSPRTKIIVRGKKAKLSKVRVGFTATTLRIDGGPAVEVIAVPPKKAQPARPNPAKPKPAKPTPPSPAPAQGQGQGKGTGPNR
jgi:hypothetical protein